MRANPAWVKELEIMVATKVKAEIQALSSFGFQYLSQTYLPLKLQVGRRRRCGGGRGCRVCCTGLTGCALCSLPAGGRLDLTLLDRGWGGGMVWKKSLEKKPKT